MTATELLNSSLRLINVLASGETPSSDESADGLVVLQQLLENWSGVELIPFATHTETIVIGGFLATYNVATRPDKILSADVLAGGMTFPVQVGGPDAWAAFPRKSDSSPKPEIVYCDYAFPTATVQVGPLPSGAATLHLYCNTALATLASGATVFSMPPGWAKAVRYNLAVDLAAEYGRTVPPEVAAIALDSRNGLVKLHASNRAGKSELEIPPVAA